MDCPFCARIAADDAEAASQHAVAFPDAYPVAPGHTLVVPRRHIESIFDLPPDEYADLWGLVHKVRSALDADSANIGVNDGAAAGQTIYHGHVHVIPRRRGDAKDPRGGVRKAFPEKAKYWKE